ncbi:MAG: hypothetical protein AAFP02_01510 [Bacteroidota bacterium]
MRITIFVLLFASACVSPQQSTVNVLTAEEEQIAKALIQGSFDKIWGGVDSTEIANYHTNDFIILEHGEVWDNERIKTYIRGQLERENRPLRKNRMEYLSIEKYGNSIQMAYHNYAEFIQADTLLAKRQWLESALAIKTQAGWRLKMMHSTRVPN